METKDLAGDKTAKQKSSLTLILLWTGIFTLGVRIEPLIAPVTLQISLKFEGRSTPEGSLEASDVLGAVPVLGVTVAKIIPDQQKMGWSTGCYHVFSNLDETFQ